MIFGAQNAAVKRDGGWVFCDRGNDVQRVSVATGGGAARSGIRAVSSSVVSFSPNLVWFAHFGTGNLDVVLKNYYFFARAVRGGP